jgi:hypothetical protein
MDWSRWDVSENQQGLRHVGVTKAIALEEQRAIKGFDSS